MGLEITTGALTRGLSAVLADNGTWYSLGTLLTAAGFSLTQVKRVKLVAAQTVTERGSANTSAVKIGVLAADGSTKVTTDWLATDGSRDHWVHRTDLDTTFLKPGTNNDVVEITIEQ